MAAAIGRHDVFSAAFAAFWLFLLILLSRGMLREAYSIRIEGQRITFRGLFQEWVVQAEDIRELVRYDDSQTGKLHHFEVLAYPHTKSR